MINAREGKSQQYLKREDILTFGGTNAASLFLLFSSALPDCFSSFSCHFFADFFLSLMKYSPFSSSRSIYKIQNDKSIQSTICKRRISNNISTFQLLQPMQTKTIKWLTPNSSSILERALILYKEKNVNELFVCMDS